MKILIVDDAKLSRMMIMASLPDKIMEGATIIEGTNGEEAISLYKEHTPDFVFLDLTMPVLDGFEALKAIREYDQDARVIVVTADIQAKARERVLASGALAMLHKPLDSNTLDNIFSLG